MDIIVILFITALCMSVPVMAILGMLAYFAQRRSQLDHESMQGDLRFIRRRLDVLEKRIAEGVRANAPAEVHAPVAEKPVPDLAKRAVAPDHAQEAVPSDMAEKTALPASQAEVPAEPVPAAACMGDEVEIEIPLSSLLSPAAQPAMPARSIPAPRRAVAAPQPSRTFEELVGKRWMTWAGTVVVFLSAIFFLKYAFQNDLIGPTGQVALCLLAGAGVLTAGTVLLGKDMAAIGQGLMGLGLAILYATLGAACSHLYEPPVLDKMTALVLLIFVTVVGMALAVMRHALPIALLTLLGGLVTPLLIATGQNSRDGLFAYLLILNLGVLGVACYRQWRTLDIVAMIGTWVLYAGWFNRYYEPSQMTPTLAWLGVFYAVFLALPFVFHLRTKTPVTVDRFLLSLGNAIYTFTFLWLILYREHQPALGFCALGLGAVYLAMGSVFRKQLPEDTPTAFGSIGLAVTFLTMAVPLHLRAEGITLAWAVEGPVLTYLAFRFRYAPARSFAAVVMFLATFRLFTEHWPLHGLEAYTPYLNRRFLSAMCVPAAMGVAAWVFYRFRREQVPTECGQGRFLAIVAGFLALVVVQHEPMGWLRNTQGRIAAETVAACIWTLGALGYLLAGRRTEGVLIWGVGVVTMLVAGVHVAASFGLDGETSSTIFFNQPFLGGLFLAIMLFLYGHALGRRPLVWDGARVATLFWTAGILILLALCSVDVYRHVWEWEDRAIASLSVSLTWGLYAAALLVIGFWRNVRALRFGALALFGMTAFKLLFVDFSGAGEMMRIIAFLAVGLLMLAGSFGYHRMEKRLFDQGGNASEAEDSNEV